MLNLDAGDVSAGPVARIVLAARITNGTQACWVEGDRIERGRVA